MDFMFFLNSALFGIGLAMDAFSVSLANGLAEPKMPEKRVTLIAGVFAGFQALMPLCGWFLVHTLTEIFSAISPAIPFIAFALLLYIGGKMLYEGIAKKEETEEAKLTLGALLIQGVATSIDALSVGFTIADYDFLSAFVEAIIIAAMTFVICFCGVHIGKKFGTKLADKAQLLGGVILIGIGIEILLTGIIK